MAINGRFRVSMGDVFPQGAFVLGEVDKLRDFDKSTPERFVQATDRGTGEPVWTVTVLDADESAPKGSKTVTIKITASHQPVPPEAVVVAGHEFRPVEFDGMTVTPYVDDRRNRVAYCLRATGMRGPAKGAKTPGGGSGASGDADGKAAA
ncbi:MAG: plasmid replication, integration and excision activator [Pseudonocardiaceae bacterium]|nr:plasmid replication, integration and excision activator [Pseudonocardiaceae bacterium]